MTSRDYQYAIFFALLFTFISIAPTVKAENGQTYEVGTSNLNVRTAPSNDGQVIGQLGYGNQVVIFKESNGWGQTYYDGEEAWVALHYLYMDRKNEQAEHSAVSPRSGKVTVTANSVRIRSGPGTAHQMIGSTKQGDSFQLLATKDDWHQITLSNGKTGWIAGWLTNLSSDNQQDESNNNRSNIVAVADSPAPKASGNQSLAGYNIVLDPGHGGGDPGAIALDGSYEKNLALSTAQVVAKRLEDAGATVIMTRENDRFLLLEDRVAISNAYFTHAFISLHFDAYPISTVNGFSTHYYSSIGNDRKLAQSIQAEIGEQVNLNNRGIVQSNLHVLRENSDLAVLVELGFITNPYDFATIQTADYQQGVAEGITNGLLNYFNR